MNIKVISVVDGQKASNVASYISNNILLGKVVSEDKDDIDKSKCDENTLFFDNEMGFIFACLSDEEAIKIRALSDISFVVDDVPIEQPRCPDYCSVDEYYREKFLLDGSDDESYPDSNSSIQQDYYLSQDTNMSAELEALSEPLFHSEPDYASEEFEDLANIESQHLYASIPLRRSELIDNISTTVSSTRRSRRDYWIANNLRGIAADRAWDAGVIGRGVIVAVIDSGVQRLAGLRIREGKSFVAGGWDEDAKDEHGTHVAGTIAGNLRRIRAC